MKMILRPSYFILVLFLFSCGTSRKEYKESEADTRRWESMARKKYGPGVEFVFNSTKSAVLCLKKLKPVSGDMRHQVSFFVFDLSSDSAIFEDTLPDAFVEWKDNFSVLVSIAPGMEKSDERLGELKFGYIFDLRVRKMRSLDATDVQEPPQGVIR